MSRNLLEPSMVVISQDIDPCPPVADGTVVVIDVIRAFTTAAILIAGGATEIVCARNSAEATAAAATMRPKPLVVGEHRDPPFPDVDLPNSPLAVASADVAGRTVMLFTANGTQVLAQASGAPAVLAAALVNISATAAWIRQNHAGLPVRLLVSDPDGPEDLACAGYLAALLTGAKADLETAQASVLAAVGVHARLWRANASEEFWRAFVADVGICAQADAFPIALECAASNVGLPVLRPG